ncbi:MAG: flavodoxin domain-containing protein [Anaerolineae bacterium]
MKILVTYGSKYGSTRGIAERVAERLRAGGHDVTTTDVRQAGDLSDYGGVVLGSGIYAGGLHRDMTKLLTQQHDVLAGKKAAAFAVLPGCCSEYARAEGRGRKVCPAIRRTGDTAHTPHLLPVRMILRRCGFWHAGYSRAMKAEPGDFRDWPVIEAWADEIASAWA